MTDRVIVPQGIQTMMRLARLALLLIAFAIACAVMVFFLSLPSHRVHARDLDGRYAQQDPQMHAWFDSLASKKGLCCSFADGVKVEDVDWDTQDGKYRVRLCVNPPAVNTGDNWTKCGQKDWVVVPEAALITDHNKFGAAVVWPTAEFIDGKYRTAIRCFIPGAGA